ncbi:hypothetical protein ENUP19_0248G0082 [Entamoeba nuttalli]|uniref:Uncharacterized protein n=2 Tax=Entamoeba nuttalli TaxID=412467 RepID=K2H2R0_ENTNP|nr:hypothetical protein ENU1_043860 [Entamoeba nuttalli P19]EKE41808.1 hypothetical protein ENU1_043860 [Entamoeba nuttalli P19]|eukprot:XP_008855848.1 hypothetical protein ENU1_043860 [Entamoeba nuttalli P19]
MNKLEGNPLQHVVNTTTSLQALMKIVRQKTERKDADIERLEKEARRDVIEGIQAMEVLVEQIQNLSKQSVDEQQQEMDVLIGENIILQKKIETSKKEIELLQKEVRNYQEEKTHNNEEYEKKVEDLEERIKEKNNEISALENEILSTLQKHPSVLNTNEDNETNIMILKIQLKKKENEIEELAKQIDKLKSENEKLRTDVEVNSQTNDVMWMTIIKGRNENNSLKNKIDELLKGVVGSSETDIFEGFVQRGELDQIKKWTEMKSFKKVCNIEGDGDQNSWSCVKGLKNVLCIKVTQIGSVFGYFHSKEHPAVTTWNIPPTTDIVFSLRNLFNSPPIIIKQNVQNKLVENKPADVCVPIITEEIDSPCLCSLIFVGEK